MTAVSVAGSLNVVKHPFDTADESERWPGLHRGNRGRPDCLLKVRDRLSPLAEQRPPAGADNEQPQEKQEVVVAGENVFDTQAQEGAEGSVGGGAGGHGGFIGTLPPAGQPALAMSRKSSCASAEALVHFRFRVRRPCFT